MTKHLKVVPRVDDDMDAFAVVQWEGTATPQNIFNRLQAAVTEWVNTTEEGKEAWENSVEDFNIGDLENEIFVKDDNDSLTTILRRHGIEKLEVDTFGSPKTSVNWQYDDVLVC